MGEISTIFTTQLFEAIYQIEEDQAGQRDARAAAGARPGPEHRRIGRADDPTCYAGVDEHEEHPGHQ